MIKKQNLIYNSKTFKFIFYIAYILANTLSSALYSSRSANIDNKHVIGVHSRSGFFSLFIGVINHLAWCEKNHKIPVVVWDKTCPYYQPTGFNNSYNCWEYYFEPVSKLKYIAGNYISTSYFAPDGSGIDFRSHNYHQMMKYKHFVHKLIKKYIKIVPSTQNKINHFCNNHMKDKYIIGIHLRGTDKHREVSPVSIDKIINTANQLIPQNCPNCQFLVATDEYKLLHTAIKYLKKPVIYYDCIRSTNGQPIHLTSSIANAKIGEDILIEAQLLSRCNCFVCTGSNVSLGVSFFNPHLKTTLLTQ